MTSLNDLISELKFELSKDELPSKERLLPLVDKIEPLAARDWARIKKLERRMEAFSGKSPEELEQTLKDADSLKHELETAKKTLGDKEKLLETLARERTEKESLLTKSLGEEKAAVARLLLDAGLTNELSKANVKPSLLGAVKALIREKGILSVEGEGEIRTAVAKIVKDGAEEKKSLSDWVRDYLGSEEGKEFIAAKENAGGGAGERRNAPPAESADHMSETRFWNLPAKERSLYLSRGGTITQD